MTDIIFTPIHGGTLLLFGVFLAIFFSGCGVNRRSLISGFAMCGFNGAVQLIMLSLFSEDIIWKLYPLIVHLPTVLMLMVILKRRPLTAMAAVSTAYLFCQPAEWFGVVAYYFTESTVVEYCTAIAVLAIVFVISLIFVAPNFSTIFNKEPKEICIFAMVPFVYYVFDYAATVYTNSWYDSNPIAAEFLPLFLCIVFVVFCTVYHNAYEKRADAERKEQIVRITVEQQAKELEAVRRGESELRMLRHDLRLFLNTLAYCIENDEKSTVRDMVTSYSNRIAGTHTKRYCTSDTVNYVLTDFAEKCLNNSIIFTANVELAELKKDEVMFSSILSNALDNAYNAQDSLPSEKRHIRLMLKESEGKILLSVKNYIDKDNPPVFYDGLPVSSRKGHGYGTQSIRYLSERLGGNCRFSVQDDMFITRVII